MELLALLVASICHDMGHSNRDTAFNPKAQMAFSVLYKDQPVLETFHCSSIIHILSKPNCNILSGIDTEQLTEFWKLLVDFVLAIDRTKHMRLLEKIQEVLTKKEGQFDITSPINRAMLLKLVVICAIHAHMAREFGPEKPWCTSLCEEAFPRVDSRIEETFVETSDGDINIAKAQVNALETYYVPLFTTLAKIVPSLQPVAECVQENYLEWKDIVSPDPNRVSKRRKQAAEAGNNEEEEQINDGENVDDAANNEHANQS